MTCQEQLQDLHERKIGEFCIDLRTKPKRRIGHFDVSLFLQDKNRAVSKLPIITGVLSLGNRRQKVFPWFDIHYLDRVDFAKGESTRLSQKKGLTESLFRIVGETIPPGGMIFLSYLTDYVWEFQSRLHEFTRRAVSVSSLRIPAAALPLGRLLFLSGCQNIKSDVYDVQGSGRIAGEKAPTLQYKETFLKRLVVQLEEYLSHESSEPYASIEEICRSHATEILESARLLLGIDSGD
jgi:hypothetical protein